MDAFMHYSGMPTNQPFVDEADKIGEFHNRMASDTCPAELGLSVVRVGPSFPAIEIASLSHRYGPFKLLTSPPHVQLGGCSKHEHEL